MRILWTATLVAGTLFAAEPWRFVPRHIDEKVAGCDDPKDGCAHAEFTYVEAVGGPVAARERVNKVIRDYVVSRPGDDLVLTPAEYAKHFVADYEQVKRQEKDFLQRWTLSKTLKVIRTAPPVLCVEYSEWSYLGGTHGNGGTSYLVFDAVTGARTELTAIVKPGALARLTAIAEAHFRTERKLAPSADLKEAGFWFEDRRFKLNENFGVSEKELRFHYNAYEIGPYTMGETDIAIPFSEIRDLLRPEIRP